MDRDLPLVQVRDLSPERIESEIDGELEVAKSATNSLKEEAPDSKSADNFNSNIYSTNDVLVPKNSTLKLKQIISKGGRKKNIKKKSFNRMNGNSPDSESKKSRVYTKHSMLSTVELNPGALTKR